MIAKPRVIDVEDFLEFGLMLDYKYLPRYETELLHLVEEAGVEAGTCFLLHSINGQEAQSTLQENK